MSALSFQMALMRWQPDFSVSSVRKTAASSCIARCILRRKVEVGVSPDA